MRKGIRISYKGNIINTVIKRMTSDELLFHANFLAEKAMLYNKQIKPTAESEERNGEAQADARSGLNAAQRDPAPGSREV